MQDAPVGQNEEEMLYRKNIGSRQSLARIVGGVLIVACSLGGVGTTPLGLVLAASGVATLLTGLFGYCPACAAVGRKSRLPESPDFKPPKRPSRNGAWACWARTTPRSSSA